MSDRSKLPPQEQKAFDVLQRVEDDSGEMQSLFLGANHMLFVWYELHHKQKCKWFMQVQRDGKTSNKEFSNFHRGDFPMDLIHEIGDRILLAELNQ